MEDKDIDKLFRSALQNAEATPSDNVWQGIEKALDKQQENIVPMGKQRGFHWGHYSAAASVLLALGVVWWTVEFSELDAPQTKMAQADIVHRPVEAHSDKEPALILPTIADPEPSKAKMVQNLEVNSKQLTSNPVSTGPEVRNIEVPPLETQGIELSVPNNLPTLTSINTEAELPTYRVTDIDPIQPLIEPEEEMESMYASTVESAYNKNTIVTSLLNTISEKVETNSKREVRFRADEEGSIRIDILNSLVKNRNKKRR